MRSRSEVSPRALWFLLLLSGLASSPARAEDAATPAAKVVQGRADGTNRVNIVFLGDGYRAEEEGGFDEDVQRSVAGLFSFSPYREYRAAFNVYSVFHPSKESGADYPAHPDRAMGPGIDNYYIEKDTAFGAIFPFRESNDVNAQGERVYSHNSNYRGLSVDWLKAQAAAAAAVPVVDMTIVLVNTDKWGGAAISLLGVCTVSARGTGAKLGHVAAHETSHVLGALADEYDYGLDTPHEGFLFEFDAPNVSTDSDPTQVKWRRWIEAGKLGPPVEGATYYKGKAYRPREHCEMRDSGGYCPVCAEALAVSIREKVDPIDEALPDPELVVAAPGAESPVFEVRSVYRAQVKKTTVTDQPPRWHWFLGWVKGGRQAVVENVEANDPAVKTAWYVGEGLEPEDTGGLFALAPGLLSEGRAEVRVEVDFDPGLVLANPYAEGIAKGLFNQLKGGVRRLLGLRTADAAPAPGREFMISRRAWQVEAPDRLAKLGEPRVFNAAGQPLERDGDWQARAGETVRIEVDVTGGGDYPVVVRHQPPGEARTVTVPMSPAGAARGEQGQVHTAMLGPFRRGGRLAFKIGLQRRTDASGDRFHAAVPGDTLTDIARRFGTDWRTLWQANPWIKNPDLIHPGERIRIPPKS